MWLLFVEDTEKIVVGDAEQIEYIQTIHSLCKECKVMFEEKLPYFKMCCISCREIFPEGARPA
jgi:hypothetical protein